MQHIMRPGAGSPLPLILCLLLASLLSCTSVHRADFRSDADFVISSADLSGRGISYNSLGLIQVNCRGAGWFLGLLPPGPDFQDCLDEFVEKAQLAGADGVIYLEFDARGPTGIYPTFGWIMQKHRLRGETIRLTKE